MSETVVAELSRVSHDLEPIGYRTLVEPLSLPQPDHEGRFRYVPATFYISPS